MLRKTVLKPAAPRSLLLTLLIGCAPLLAPTAVYAETDEDEDQQSDTSREPGSGPNPFTQCGIGAALFPNTSWLAVTSNVIWDIGATAITSAVSSPQTCSAKEAATARLIIETLPELERDLALGAGPYLDVLYATIECDSAAHPALGAELRKAYGASWADESYAEQTRVDKASLFYGSVRRAVKVASGCKGFI